MIATFSLHLPMDDSHFGYKQKFIKKLKKHYLESTFNLKYRMKYFTYSPFTTYLKIFTCPQL